MSIKILTPKEIKWYSLRINRAVSNTIEIEISGIATYTQTGGAILDFPFNLKRNLTNIQFDLTQFFAVIDKICMEHIGLI